MDICSALLYTNYGMQEFFYYFPHFANLQFFLEGFPFNLCWNYYSQPFLFNKFFVQILKHYIFLLLILYLFFNIANTFSLFPCFFFFFFFCNKCFCTNLQLQEFFREKNNKECIQNGKTIKMKDWFDICFPLIFVEMLPDIIYRIHKPLTFKIIIRTVNN